VTAPRDFWLACGHHLLDRDGDGRLIVTDAFLKAYLARPELAPPPDACAAERALHRALLADPLRPVAPGEIAALEDADARENWEVMVAWRDHLVRHETLEAAYLALARRGQRFPHLFLDHLVQAILRNALDVCEDAFVLRAAELFFRPQKLVLQEGSLVAADAETVAGANAGPVSPLISLLGLPKGAEIAVLGEANADSYWDRSDHFDLALDLTAGRRGLAGLAEVIARWVSHLLTTEVAVEPMTALRDVPLTWYVGLDAEGTRIGDALWHGKVADEAGLVGLFRLTFADPADMADSVRGQPVFLLMAMSADKVLRLKPQNLLTGLPIRVVEAAI
jgi:hypothetical protein